ncbi:MAG: AMP-binding protein [Armatimonadota bacterium]
MNLVDALLQQAAERPSQPAIIETRRGKSRTITFAELDAASARAATLLQAADLQPGDGVLLLQPMSIELYVALVALFRLGLTAIILDPSAGRAHIERCCAISPPAAFIGSPKAHLLRLISPAVRRIPRHFILNAKSGDRHGCPQTTGHPSQSPFFAASTFGANCPPLHALHDGGEDAPALLTFTSGSTGQPKAALRTHGFLLAQYRALASSLRLQPGEVDLATLPVFVLANLAAGVVSLLPDADLRRPGAIAPAPVLAQIRAFGPTRTVASPALLERLADYCLPRGETLPEFTAIYTGGAPVFPRLLDALHEVAPRAQIYPVYGSTEAEPIAHLSRDDISEEDRAAMLHGSGLLAGPPVPEIDLRILRQQWGESVGPFTGEEFAGACLPAGEAGEIVVSGAHVLPGYLHGQGDAETKFRVDGVPWHRTGDAGYLDDRGRLWLLGRCQARVEDARGILYPFAVEVAALAHPGVRRAALAAPAGRRMLVLELSGDMARIDLAKLSAALSWAGLDTIRLLRHIPVDARHNAKIDYPALYELLKKGH